MSLCGSGNGSGEWRGLEWTIKKARIAACQFKPDSQVAEIKGRRFRQPEEPGIRTCG